MPIYEYFCENCSHQFEKRQRFSDEPVVVCPQCTSDARRIFSPVPIIFKGSGFYVTDHKGVDRSTVTNKDDGDKPADVAKKTEPAKTNETPTTS